jgi:hypothetical protein
MAMYGRCFREMPVFTGFSMPRVSAGFLRIRASLWGERAVKLLNALLRRYCQLVITTRVPCPGVD